MILIYFLFFPTVLGDLRRRDSAEAGGLQSQRQHRCRMRGWKTWNNHHLQADTMSRWGQDWLSQQTPFAWGLAHMPYSCCTTCCRTLPNIMGNNRTQTAFDRLFLNDESHYTRNCVNIAALTYYCLFLMDNWIQIPEQQSQACWGPFLLLNILYLQLEIATVNI